MDSTELAGVAASLLKKQILIAVAFKDYSIIIGNHFSSWPSSMI